MSKLQSVRSRRHSSSGDRPRALPAIGRVALPRISGASERDYVVVISSAEEFVELRTSTDPHRYGRAAAEAATDEIWLDVIERFPDMRFWVAQNKTVPLEVLRILATDEDSRVRLMVAMKRKADEQLLRLLAEDPSDGVRSAVARHRRCPSDVLRRMADSDSWATVREQASERLRAM